MPGHLRRRSLVLTLTLLVGAAVAPQSASAAAPVMATAMIADGLVIPWDVAFVPDGTMLVTERPGRVRVYSSGAVGASLIRTITIPSIRAEGESGLMGIAVDVDFASNRFVYVCASRQISGSWVNQVLRYTISTTGSWISGTVLLSGMRANTIHNGCSLEMDRFGKLWIGMGDSGDAPRAQNRNSLNGKILRINRDGSIPSDNPVISGTRNAVYSMGHRNPQGIAIRPGTDQVYAAEHGPDVNDEVNLIVAGGNYGWPCYTGAGSPYQTSGCGPAIELPEFALVVGQLDDRNVGRRIRGRLPAVAGLRRPAVRQHAEGERRSALLDQPRRNDARCPRDALQQQLGTAARHGVRARWPALRDDLQRQQRPGHPDQSRRSRRLVASRAPIVTGPRRR